MVFCKRSILNGRGPFLGYLRQEVGNVAAITALLLVPIIGALSMGVEASSWFFTGRSAQNAADSAAVAAANNGTSGQFQSEGQANAQQYGFSGANVTVSVVNGQSCPDGTSACYKATVTKVMPIYLTRIVGFSGDTTIGGQPAVTITSSAWAEPISAIKYPSCLTSTGNDSNGNGLNLQGIPKSSMPGCSVSAVGPSSPVSCNGQGIGGDPSIFSTGTIDPRCTTGNTAQNRPSSIYQDPYAKYYQNIPCGINTGDASPNCSSGAPPTCSAFTGTLTVGACYTGNIAYSKPKGSTKTNTVNLTGPTNGGVIYIKNGSINLDYLALTSTNVTYVFTGTSPGGFTGGSNAGSLNIAGPSSGTWSGVAAYQDTHLASSTYVQNPSWSDNGSSPTVDVVGLMYLPRTDVSFGGGAGSTVGSSSCFIAIFHSLDDNGTALSMTRTGCTSAGLNNLPTVQILRAALVK